MREFTPEERQRYDEILEQHHRRGSRGTCYECGEKFRLDNIYICIQCGVDYCFRCVWHLKNFGDEDNPRWRCPCGGEVL